MDLGSAQNCEIGIVQSPPPPARKGYGLKKWRRIKRSSPNQNAAEAEDENGKVLKRGLSSASIPPAKPLQSDSESGSRFAFGAPACFTDSENSRSSTAASSKVIALGYGRMKNLVAKNQQGNTIAENNKKQRGDEESSQSSMESDSRSSNFVFTQGVSSATSNGRSNNYLGENRKENLYETEGKDKKGKGENLDSLLDSIRALQSVQEALEKEVHNLGDVGKEPVSLQANSVIENGVHLDTTDCLASENIGEKASSTLDTQGFTLTQKVNFLEFRLEEAKVAIELKDTRIAELEATINGSKSIKEGLGSSAGLQEMESEFEGLFQQKLETEIEYLALAKATEKLRIAAIDERKLFEEQKSIMSNQVQALSHLGEAEQKAAVVKKQVEKIEKYCGDMIGTEEILKMQRRACKLTFSFFIQLILLVLVLWVFVLELSYPQSGVIVPT